MSINKHNFSALSGVTVKEERFDEAEINEMAAKMKETYRQGTVEAAGAEIIAATGRIPPGMPTTTNYKLNIRNYESRIIAPPPPTKRIEIGNKSQDLTKQKNDAAAAANEKDEESRKGRFGWTTFGKTHIPFILRQTERYCSVRMLESELLKMYLNNLHADILSYTCVKSYYITEAECRLFNEINFAHCDSTFTGVAFTLNDLIVELSEATNFYHFLDICYKKLVMGRTGPSDKCGFIRINKQSVVAYTVRDGDKFIPLFYFEGETENLKLKAEILSGWDLSYLKFCCKVQCIQEDFFASDSIHVIRLADIKRSFPTDTKFEDYWPNKVVDRQLFVPTQRNSNNARHWTKQPQQPPPKKVIHIVAKNTSRVRKQPPYVQGAPNAILSAPHGLTTNVQALTSGWPNISQNQTTIQPNLLTQAHNEGVLRLIQARAQAQQAQAQQAQAQQGQGQQAQAQQAQAQQRQGQQAQGQQGQGQQGQGQQGQGQQGQGQQAQGQQAQAQQAQAQQAQAQQSLAQQAQAQQAQAQQLAQAHVHEQRAAYANPARAQMQYMWRQPYNAYNPLTMGQTATHTVMGRQPYNAYNPLTMGQIGTQPAQQPPTFFSSTPQNQLTKNNDRY